MMRTEDEDWVFVLYQLIITNNVVVINLVLVYGQVAAELIIFPDPIIKEIMILFQ